MQRRHDIRVVGVKFAVPGEFQQTALGNRLAALPGPLSQFALLGFEFGKTGATDDQSSVEDNGSSADLGGLGVGVDAGENPFSCVQLENAEAAGLRGIERTQAADSIHRG